MDLCPLFGLGSASCRKKFEHGAVSFSWERNHAIELYSGYINVLNDCQNEIVLSVPLWQSDFPQGYYPWHDLRYGALNMSSGMMEGIGNFYCSEYQYIFLEVMKTNLNILTFGKCLLCGSSEKWTLLNLPGWINEPQYPDTERRTATELFVLINEPVYW